MENLLSIILSIIWFIIASVIVSLPIICFIKFGAVQTHIEGDSNIIKYIIKGSENSQGCSDFLRQHNFICPLTKEYLQILKKSDSNHYDYLVTKLNIIINQERILRNTVAHC